MKTINVIWLKRFADKIEVKHQLNQDEVEEAFRNQPRFQFAQQGDIEGEDLYRAFGRTDAGRYVVVFFIYKRRGQALVISARNANKNERKHYGKTKNMRTTKKSRDPLPEHFKSLEEAAEFWDTHDSGDYDEYFVDVDCEVDLKPRTHLIAIDGALYEKLRAIARKKRVATEKLVSRWIAEKLKSAA